MKTSTEQVQDQCISPKERQKNLYVKEMDSWIWHKAAHENDMKFSVYFRPDTNTLYPLFKEQISALKPESGRFRSFVFTWAKVALNHLRLVLT